MVFLFLFLFRFLFPFAPHDYSRSDYSSDAKQGCRAPGAEVMRKAAQYKNASIDQKIDTEDADMPGSALGDACILSMLWTK